MVVVFVVELEVALERIAAAMVLLRRRLANIFGLEFAVIEFKSNRGKEDKKREP